MKFFYFFVFLFLLINCTPPSITYKRIVENNSSHDIWLINPNSTITCSGGFAEETLRDSVLVASNTSHVLEYSMERNSSVNAYANCPFMCIDSVDTRISNHDSLNLNFPLESTNTNWQYSVLSPGESGSCECRLTIDDSDIN